MNIKNSLQKKQTRKIIIQGLLFLCFLIAMYFFIEKANLSIDDLLKYQPENKILAALLFLLFFAIKSITVFFPVPILYLAVGHFFSLPWAITINFLGILTSTSIPYFIGRRKGKRDIDELLQDHDTMKKLLALQHDNVAFFTYMLRMCQLPMDLTSLFLGATDLPYWPYMIGNLCGMAPAMLGITLIGENISDPKSPLFKQSLLWMLLMIAVSLLVFYRFIKKKYPQGLKNEIEQKEVDE